jgi:hypothetical protein
MAGAGSNMRWTARIAFPILFVFLVYTIWPFVDLYRLAKAVEARNPAAVSERVDFGRLRVSVGEQILATYQRLRGREASPLARGVLAGLGEPFGEHVIGAFISPESLVELFAEGWPRYVLPDKPATAVSLTPNWNRIFDLYINSEYTLRDFSIWLPVRQPLPQRFRLRMQLAKWRWKLVGIDLPEHLRVALAEEVSKALHKK